MPVLLAILGALAAAAFWWYRLSLVKDMDQDIFGAAVAEMDAPLSRAEIAALETETRAILKADAAEAVRRLAKVGLDKAGAKAGPDLVNFVNRVANIDEVGMNDRQVDALRRVSHRFGLSR